MRYNAAMTKILNSVFFLEKSLSHFFIHHPLITIEVIFVLPDHADTFCLSLVNLLRNVQEYIFLDLEMCTEGELR